jgi:hypothetical protein
MNRSSTAGTFIRRSGQSLVEDDEEVDLVDAELDEDPVSALVDVSDDDVSDDDAVALFSPLSSAGFLPPPELERRSFLAHPEPLNTIVGGAKALRIGPDPHSGHDSGDGSLTPWMTSKRRPHAAQV